MRIPLRVALACLLLVSFSPVQAQEAPVSRRDGFLLIWNSILRPVSPVKGQPFSDVPPGSRGFEQISYAESRGMIDSDAGRFQPDQPLTYLDALVWLFRTRNIEPLRDGTPAIAQAPLPDNEQAKALAAHYGLKQRDPDSPLTQELLLALMRAVDAALAEEEHEASLYSEKFHGKGTAFGESFDMHALTAAHRSFPYNTLVRVTNIENGKSVVVRINDRGPYVAGRDMDLSLAAFTTIAERGKGKIAARFERLGDVSLAGLCTDDRAQTRIGRDVVLTSGVPHFFTLGRTLSLASDMFFVVRSVTYPDGTVNDQQQWIGPDEGFQFTPSIAGHYFFRLGAVSGRVRSMEMEVRECGGW